MGISGRKKILVVDDDGFHLSVVEKMLEDEYEVSAAKSGEEALERLRGKFVPDMVLLDVLMPNMDGWEVYRRIRAINSLQDVPVVFFTSVTEKIEITHAYDIGAADYIMKPFEKEELLKRLETTLKKH